MKRRTNKSNQVAAVYVSASMQVALLVFLIAAGAVGFVSYLLVVVQADPMPNSTYVLMSVLQSVYPAVLFAAAYLMTSPHRHVINRAFIAAIKALIVISFYGLITVVHNHIAMLLADGTHLPPHG
jgi:hypothetical protein